ncbi:MAG: hypothetical protein HYV26_05105 [Candidatus Hydrogenedentes bacterium]|nr:hypothetical protein [Candidatus Hydrogenedentota bacterium]
MSTEHQPTEATENPKPSRRTFLSASVTAAAVGVSSPSQADRHHTITGPVNRVPVVHAIDYDITGYVGNSGLPGAKRRARSAASISDPDARERVKTIYKQINFMVYLCENVSYHTLYGAPGSSFPAKPVVDLLEFTFIPRLMLISEPGNERAKYFTADELKPDADGKNVPAKIIDKLSALVSELRRMKLLTTFRKVYTDAKNDPDSPEGRIKNSLLDVYRLKKEFCLPFIFETIDFEQDPDNRVDRLLACAGHWSLYDLFAQPKTLLLEENGGTACTVRDAVPEDVLSEALVHLGFSEDDITIMSFNCNNMNYSICTQNGCQDTTWRCYCNNSEGGGCSAYSGCCS